VLPSDLAVSLRLASTRLGPFGAQWHHYPEVESTNDVAAALAVRGAVHGTVVVADMQTAGRGRHGSVWFSPLGSGLYMSVLLRSLLSPVLTLATGVAVAEALQVGAGLEVTLEWPNDVVVARQGRHRKVAGILAEAATMRERVEWVILGIGINLQDSAWPPELADRAGSVEGLTGRPVDPVNLIVELLAALATGCAEVESGETARVLGRWEALAPSSRGATVEWSVGAVRHRGVTEGIDDQGALLVRVGSRCERLIGGEVRHVRGDDDATSD
jgi:BirA family biotin operon repressor/biotin-[acetyl-CoA-carboxylase] ligase